VSDNPEVVGVEPGRGSAWQVFKESFFSVSTFRVVRDTVLAFVFAFILGAVLLILASPEVTDAASAWDKVWGSYTALFRGAFGSVRALSVTTAQAAPLIAAGLGVALGFRVGLFNIGGQGQAIWGAAFAAAVGFSLHLPAIVHIPLAIAAGVAGGAAWGGIAGILRAKFGANEVIVTIMMNYVALKLLLYLLMNQLHRPGAATAIAPVIDESAALPFISGTRFHLGFLLVLGAAALVWWLLDHTRLGFSIRAVGGNQSAAATAGMNVPVTLTMSMVIGGALCGLAGTFLVLGPNIQGYQDALSSNIVGSVGFDAITVALLGRSKPLGTVIAGLLFGALKAGALSMQAAQTPGELADVIQAMIVMFIAAPALVRTLVFVNGKRKSKAVAEPVAATPSLAAEVVSA
jgi:simple sugar transport system permease protein